MDAWQPIATVPDPGMHRSRVGLGHHLGKTYTLADGRVIVIWHNFLTREPEHWLELPTPPNLRRKT